MKTNHAPVIFYYLMDGNKKFTLRKIALIGNYLPRQCGIATFTSDLCESIATQFPRIETLVVAMNDQPSGYDYPARVRFEIPQEDIKMYQCAADFLNLNDVDLVCVQHEFGIFGGKAGSHILTLLRDLHIPVVTTLHTILTNPNPDQRLLMNELMQLSDRVIVMSQRGVTYLQEVSGVPHEKIDLIPHGIPDVSFVDPSFYKDKFDVEGKQVLLTFGLLSANKGIENVIHALPMILEQYPDVIYMVLGKTHPHVKNHEGERYRHSLESLAKELGVEENVVFYDQFVSLDELVEFIGAADIYITPYLNPDQIVSGTLAYTVGAGKAVISTPYWYALELLADGRGKIVPFRDPGAIAEQVLYLLDNEKERHAIRKRAYLYARDMVWAKVAQQYMSSFERAIEERANSPQTVLLYPDNEKSYEKLVELPPVNLNHLARMTDDTGILQHAVFHLPNYSEGYTTDDNARALVLAVLLDRLMNRDGYEDITSFTSRYLAFVWHAFDPEKNRFRNFMGYDRHWIEGVGSEDSHGRALWSLGAVLGQSNNENLKGVAASLFSRAITTTLGFSSPRAWAFALLGIHEYLRRFPGDRAVIRAGEQLAKRLIYLYRKTRRPGWYWFEDIVTYNNATLPHALFLTGQWMRRPGVARVALESLRWLADIQTSPQGNFTPIGNKGFFKRGGEKARFDQQPIEASAMVSACLEVYRSTGDVSWLLETQRAFAWFLGQNDLGLPVYDANTGGCRDGLHPDRANKNQGAESTLAFLLSLAELRLLTPSRLSATSEAKTVPALIRVAPANDQGDVRSW